MTDSTVPTIEDFQSRAADQGFEFELARYAAALSTHAGMRDALLRLRKVPLSFLEPTEPNSALVWIENGGESK
ncbi:MAG: hypothetical protein JWN95_1955 [Frankiales bacterium]|nr:hypothetical protein [Frankiales bacterium]